MCDCTRASAQAEATIEKFHKRDLAKFLLGATGAAVLGSDAEAANVTALGITCIDYRLVEDGVHFFHDKHLTKDYDQVSLAGASLAAVSDKFPSSNAAFWNHIEIAKTLHHIRKVIVVDHRDCGAYKVAFGKDYRADPAGETEQHKHVMEQVKARLAKTHPELESEFYLMGLDGKAERVV